MRSPIPQLPRGAWMILGVDSLSAVGSGLTLPFLVVYLHTIRGLDLGLAGLVAATIAVFSLAGNPFGGWLTDRLGPQAALATGLAIAAAGSLCLAGVQNAPQAFAATAVLGTGVAMAWPSQDTLLTRLVP